MSSKIDEKTQVPLGYVIICLFAILGMTINGSFWVKGVNDRLQRIESKLGIKEVNADPVSDAVNGAINDTLNVAHALEK